MSLAVIDDIIERGSLADWLELADLATKDKGRRQQIQTLATESFRRSERPDRAAFWIAFCNEVAQ